MALKLSSSLSPRPLSPPYQKNYSNTRRLYHEDAEVFRPLAFSDWAKDWSFPSPAYSRHVLFTAMFYNYRFIFIFLTTNTFLKWLLLMWTCLFLPSFPIFFVYTVGISRQKSCYYSHGTLLEWTNKWHYEPRKSSKWKGQKSCHKVSIWKTFNSTSPLILSYCKKWNRMSYSFLILNQV